MSRLTVPAWLLKWLAPAIAAIAGYLRGRVDEQADELKREQAAEKTVDQARADAAVRDHEDLQKEVDKWTAP